MAKKIQLIFRAFETTCPRKVGQLVLDIEEYLQTLVACLLKHSKACYFSSARTLQNANIILVSLLHDLCCGPNIQGLMEGGMSTDHLLLSSSHDCGAVVALNL